MNNKTKQNTSRFYIISVLALIWNILGVIAYLGQVYMPQEIKQALPPAEQSYYANVPSWVTGAFAIAVFAGALGCIALLLKKKIAISLLFISLIAVLVQFVYNTIIQTDMEVTVAKLVWPVLIIAIAIFLVWFSKDSKTKGYIS
ncbi:MAG: hypothetical protein R3342_00755 [Lutibacter sp.]|uniref:hypothetical protein n=1 Tax=Lutibacter sp. TaxID=1925666 RepID=UPI00299D684B|nr:hypothetical protein [Lutibacter sp.]MDX1828049.1 hypothetical protein [Lutibacter sp.]